MEINSFFTITGTSNQIKSALVDNVVINKVNSDILFDIIQNNINLLSLSNGEEFEELSVVDNHDGNYLGLLLNNTEYHINIKFITLAIICWIFDITITKGLASILLNVYGVDYSQVKLEGLEKCVAYKIQTEKKVRAEQLKSLIQCNFTLQNKKCGKHCKDGTCKDWNDNDIQNAINSLISKKVIKLKGDYYGIIF